MYVGLYTGNKAFGVIDTIWSGNYGISYFYFLHYCIYEMFEYCMLLYYMSLENLKNKNWIKNVKNNWYMGTNFLEVYFRVMRDKI